MTTVESNLSFEAFIKLCEAMTKSDLVGLEECQYWLFELGYKAALENQTSREMQGRHAAQLLQRVA